MTRILYLTKGKECLVDDSDWAFLSQWRWTFQPKNKGSEDGYAVRWITFEGGKREKVYLHRFLLGAPAQVFVDHKNGKGLDDRRRNLRISTVRQNSVNRYLHRGRTIEFRGVTQDKKGGKYRARFGPTHLGMFTDPEKAAKAYDWAVVQAFGVFAQTNFSFSLYETILGSAPQEAEEDIPFA